jgi:hypothetical protein
MDIKIRKLSNEHIFLTVFLFVTVQRQAKIYEK